MSEATTEENLQRFASSPYAPSWQKEVVAELCAARERIRQLEARIKQLEDRIKGAEQEGSATRCPWCNAWPSDEAGDDESNCHGPTKHYDDCEAFTPEGELK